MKTNHGKLGTAKISKLLWSQSLPAMTGLIFVSVYNFVDAIFIGQGVGPLGLSGLAVSIPVHMIIMGLAQTIGVGAAALISLSLGAGHHHKAARALGNFFILIISVSVVASALGLIFLEPMLILFGATPEILPYAADYLGIILLGMVFLSVSAAGNNVIRAEGNAKYAMFVVTVPTIVNLILDPILIFGYQMGMKGAALATIIGFFMGGVMVFAYFLKNRGSIKLKASDFRLDLKIIKEIFSVGSATFARQAAASVLIIIINKSLTAYGSDSSIATYGIISRITMLIYMPLFGLVQGMQPILGYNHGAGKFSRAREVIIRAIMFSTYISVISFIVLYIFAEQISSWFTSDPVLISQTAGALRIIILALPLTGLQTVAGGLFQSIGKALPALIITLLRQVIFLVPIVLILPLYLGLDGVFIAIPTAEFCAVVVVLMMTINQIKKFKENDLVIKS